MVPSFLSSVSVTTTQWLFTTASSEETVLRVPASGIVQTLLAAEGETVQEDSTVAVITTSCALRIDVSADDAPRFTAGSTWYYTRGDDAHETHLPAKVLRVPRSTPSLSPRPHTSSGTYSRVWSVVGKHGSQP